MSLLDSKVLDINAEALGVSVDELMDNAGKALAAQVKREFEGRKILVVCGVGNNGGDGLAAAYHLREEDVTVALIEPREQIRTEAARKRLEMLTVQISMFNDVDVDDHDVVLDCVLGAGVKGRLRDNVRSYIDKMMSYKGKIISADIPTGLGCNISIAPAMTVTFHDIKDGMNEDNSGKILIVDIGIPREAYENVGPGDMLRYPIPKKDSHKGQNGRLLVIGGGPYVGAPAMSGMAAFRVGADSVRIATPSKSFVPIASMSPSFIMHELPGDILTKEHVPELKGLSEKVDAVLIGPGLGKDVKTQTAISMFLVRCEKPVIIDADAIASLGDSEFWFKMPMVLTPHRRELKELLNGASDRTADDYAGRHGKDITIVSKGQVDEITNGHIMRRNITGTPAMTVGGTGDVLAGVIAGLVAKGMNTFDAACLGTYINGRAGEIAFSQYSYGMIATDLIESIPAVLRESL